MYAKRYYDIEEIKKIDIQNGIGVYYYTDTDNIKEEFYDYFDIDKNDKSDFVSLTKKDFDKVIDIYKIEYDYTDGQEIDNFLSNLMNYKKYDYFLVVLFNATWNGASGYKIFKDYFNAFFRDYDNTMYYVGGTKGGKAITLREYSHDKPLGYNSAIVGLTEREYNKLSNCNIEKIIDFGRKFL